MNDPTDLGDNLSRDDARSLLRLTFEPIRERVLVMDDYPDMLDALHLLDYDWNAESWNAETWKALVRLVEQAGLSTSSHFTELYASEERE